MVVIHVAAFELAEMVGLLSQWLDHGRTHGMCHSDDGPASTLCVFGRHYSPAAVPLAASTQPHSHAVFMPMRSPLGMLALEDYWARMSDVVGWPANASATRLRLVVVGLPPSCLLSLLPYACSHYLTPIFS